MMFEDRVGDMAVRDELDRAVVVAQLLFGQDVRAVAVNPPVDAYDLFHDAGDRADVVRDHHDRHAVVEFAERAVEFVFEFVVHEIRGFVENQQPRVRDHGPAQQRALHLSSRYFADRIAGDCCDAGHFEQLLRPQPVLLRVAGQKPAAALQTGEDDFLHRDRKIAVEIRLLGHVADQPLLAAEQLRGEFDAARVGDRPEDGLHQRRLAASVGTDHAQEIPFADLQIHVLQRLVPVVFDSCVV